MLQQSSEDTFETDLSIVTIAKQLKAMKRWWSKNPFVSILLIALVITEVMGKLHIKTACAI